MAQLFDWYLEPQATIYRLARRLTDLGVPTPTGKPRWNVASVRGILRNPAYAGRALTNRTQVAPARRRKSAMLPAGPGVSHAPRPEEDWIAVPVPPVVSEETFAQVQAKLDANQQSAARNTRHEYLLRALVSCGACRLACTGRQTAGRLPLLPVPRAHRPAARGPGAALHRPLHPRRAAGRAGLGRPVRAADRPRPGHPRAGPGTGRRLAAPGAPGPAGHHPPGPGPAGPPAAAAAGRLPRRGRRHCPSWSASARTWTAAAPPCSPSSASWTPPPGSGWNSAPSPTGSRHSARPSGPGWPPPPSSSGGCWPSCSSTG